MTIGVHRLVGRTLLAACLAGIVAAAPARAAEILNVSYDPTRELYRDINAECDAQAMIGSWTDTQAKHFASGRIFDSFAGQRR